MRGILSRGAFLTALCCVMSVAAVSPAVAGQSFNLDFGGTWTGLPNDFGGAANIPGVWVDVPANTPIANLSNVAGESTPVVITVAGLGEAAAAPVLTPGILLRDGVVSGARGADFAVTVTGLPDGVYDVFYYSREPTSGLTLNEQPLADLGGSSADLLVEQGNNWDVQRTTVSGGTLLIEDRTPGSDGLAGIQIVHIPPPQGESYNLDFGTWFTGLPDTFGAAAQQPGHWVDVPANMLIYNLPNITGQPTPATLLVAGIEDQLEPQTTTAGLLLRDEIRTEPPEWHLRVTLNGLGDGVYDVYFYHHDSIGGLTLNGQEVPEAAGGGGDEIGPQASNWSVLRTTVRNGLLVIEDLTSNFSGALSGLQVVHVPPPAKGESYNLDFWTAYPGLPDTFSGAASQPGTWVDVPENVPILNLVNTAGEATSASLTVTGKGGDHVPPTTVAGQLLRDHIEWEYSHPLPFTVKITELFNGVYDIYYYSPAGESGLQLNGQALPEIAGGSADQLGVQGTNWGVLRTTVGNGRLVIDTEDGFFGQLSGLQVVYVPPPAQGESYNLDFGDAFTGLPVGFGAASGQTGTWVDVPLNTPLLNVLNVDGQPTTASITVTGFHDAFSPQTTTAGILLRDGGTSDLPDAEFGVTLTGLFDGFYEIYYYHHAATTDLTLNGQPLPNLAGDSADGLGAQGTNWNVVQTAITGGVLELEDRSPGGDGLSGIQVIFLAPPALIYCDGFEDNSGC